MVWRPAKRKPADGGQESDVDFQINFWNTAHKLDSGLNTLHLNPAARSVGNKRDTPNTQTMVCLRSVCYKQRLGSASEVTRQGKRSGGAENINHNSLLSFSSE